MRRPVARLSCLRDFMDTIWSVGSASHSIGSRGTAFLPPELRGNAPLSAMHKVYIISPPGGMIRVHRAPAVSPCLHPTLHPNGFRGCGFGGCSYGLHVERRPAHPTQQATSSFLFNKGINPLADIVKIPSPGISASPALLVRVYSATALGFGLRSERSGVVTFKRLNVPTFNRNSLFARHYE